MAAAKAESYLSAQKALALLRFKEQLDAKATAQVEVPGEGLKQVGMS